MRDQFSQNSVGHDIVVDQMFWTLWRPFTATDTFCVVLHCILLVVLHCIALHCIVLHDVRDKGSYLSSGWVIGIEPRVIFVFIRNVLRQKSLTATVFPS